MVDAQFVSEKVAESEKAEGATAVKPSTTASKFKDGFSVVIGHSAELGGNIGLNFFTEFKEGTDLEGAMATVTAPNGTSKTVSQKDWKFDEATNAYKILCEVPAKDINGTVTMQITLADGTTTSTTYTYTVEQYLRALEDDPNFSDMKALVQAMRNYGEAAHLYFNGGALTDPRLTGDEKYEISESAAKIEGTLPEGVTYIGSSLMLESTTAIRHYFTCTEEAIANQYGMTKKDDVYYIESDNILAQNLAKPVTTTVEGFSITYSPMSYVNTVLKNASSDPSLAALVGILYRYYKAADAYAVANGAKQNG